MQNTKKQSSQSYQTILINEPHLRIVKLYPQILPNFLLSVVILQQEK